MPRLLNRKRPFGIIAHGGEVKDTDFQYACFEQDGSYYNQEGCPINPKTGELLPVDNVVVKPPVSKKKVDEVGDELPEVINLKAWAAGKEKHPFHLVTKEIQRIYAIFPSNKAEAIRIVQMEKPVAA